MMDALVEKQIEFHSRIFDDKSEKRKRKRYPDNESVQFPLYLSLGEMTEHLQPTGAGTKTIIAHSN